MDWGYQEVFTGLCVCDYTVSWKHILCSHWLMLTIICIDSDLKLACIWWMKVVLISYQLLLCSYIILELFTLLLIYNIEETTSNLDTKFYYCGSACTQYYEKWLNNVSLGRFHILILSSPWYLFYSCYYLYWRCKAAWLFLNYILTTITKRTILLIFKLFII